MWPVGWVQSGAVSLRRIFMMLAVIMSVGVGASEARGAPEEPVPLDAALTVTERAVREYVPRRATIISDSAMAGVRWNGALGGLRGFYADDRLESCRRLVDSSCRGREGRRPPTALVEISSMATPTPSDVLIIATGYNDFDHKFAVHARQVLGGAVAKGFKTIVWITYRENVTYLLPAVPGEAASNYRSMNAELREIVASGDYAQLQLWDLNEYTESVSESWFYSDGIHQLTRGSWGIVDWISRKMAHISQLPCPMPWGPAYGLETPCPDPNEVQPARGHPRLDALYEF